MHQSESQIQRAVCELLKSRGLFFWRNNNFPVPGRAMPKFTPKGLPDIMIVNGGQFIAFEVKRKKGDESEREPNGRRVRAGMLSPFQAEWAAGCSLAGGRYFTVRSLDEARQALSECGIAV